MEISLTVIFCIISFIVGGWSCYLLDLLNCDGTLYIDENKEMHLLVKKGSGDKLLRTGKTAKFNIKRK